MGYIADGFEPLLQKVIQDLVREEVLPYLEQEYFNKNFRDYAPVFYNKAGQSFNTYDFRSSNYDEGFRAVGRQLKDIDTAKSAKGFGFTIGPNLDRLDTRNYSAFSVTGDTPWTSWFLAVEMGTGVGSNTGGEVNLTGPTKTSPPGAWHFGRADRQGSGPRFVGQQGFHIFWDPSNRTRPREFWVQLFREKLPVRIQTGLATFLTGKKVLRPS